MSTGEPSHRGSDSFSCRSCPTSLLLSPPARASVGLHREPTPANTNQGWQPQLSPKFLQVKRSPLPGYCKVGEMADTSRGSKLLLAWVIQTPNVYVLGGPVGTPTNGSRLAQCAQWTSQGYYSIWDLFRSDFWETGIEDLALKGHSVLSLYTPSETKGPLATF